MNGAGLASAFLLGIGVGWFLAERIGAIVAVTVYPPDGGAPVERADMPPTRWQRLVGWVREAVRWGVTLGAGLVLAGWLLGGCS